MTVGSGIDGVERVLVVTAHPDDVDFAAAGTVAVWSDAGIEVAYCIATDGDAGGSDRSVSRAEMADTPSRRTAGGGPSGGSVRRHVPRLPRRSTGARPRPPPGHRPGDPPVPTRPGGCPVARAQLGPDLRQPSRPPGRRRGRAVRRLPRRPQPVRLPRAAGGGPRAPYGARTVDHGHRPGRPGGRRHRVLHRPSWPPSGPTSARWGTAITSRVCCERGCPVPHWPPDCPMVGWPSRSTWWTRPDGQRRTRF